MRTGLPLFLTLGVAMPAIAEVPPPDGWIVWASNRTGGRHDIYVARADGSALKRLTSSGATFPSWAPDGRWIAYRSLADGSAHVVRPDGSADRQVTVASPLFWMHDNSGLVCRQGDHYLLVDPETTRSKLAFEKNDFPVMENHAFDPGGVTEDGRWLVAHTDIFRQGFTAENGSYKGDHAAVLFDLKARDKLYFLGGGCEPTTAPTGTLVYHVCGWQDCAPFSPDIYRMNAADVGSRSSYQAEMAAPESDWGHEYFPRVSTDGRWLSYGASTGCHDLDQCDYEVFIHRLEEGVTSRARITSDGGNDQWPHLFVGGLWHEEPGPRLLVTPSSWHVVLMPGEAHPRLPTALLKNSGGGSLADAEVEVLYHDVAGWLSVARKGSGDEQELELALVQTRLSEGRYRATLTVRVNGAASSPQQLPILIEHGGDDPEAPGGCSMISNTPRGPSALVLALAIGLAILRNQRRRRAGRSRCAA